MLRTVRKDNIKFYVASRKKEDEIQNYLHKILPHSVETILGFVFEGNLLKDL